MTEQINFCAERRVETTEDIDALPNNTEYVFVSRLTDHKVKALSRLTRLKAIWQDGSPQITDKALSILGKMTTLEKLDLEWSVTITDAGLQQLYGLTSLRWLDLGFCPLVTTGGISALRSALPLCEIIDNRI